MTKQVLLSAMQEAARLAGRAIMSYYRPEGADPQDVSYKGRDNPLTLADLEANRILREALLAADPAAGWLSEESVDDAARLSCRRVWVVDPMDGTKEFVKGIPQFAVSIGLVEDGLPVGACIYNPALDEMFTAWRGEGGHCNGQPLRVSQRGALAGASCLASRSETGRGEWSDFQDRLQLHIMGSIAYKLALLASGRYDLTFTLTPKNQWDFCAGLLLVEEAGGRVTDKQGASFRFNGAEVRIQSLLATNGHLHSSLLELLRDTPLSPDRHVH
ncbi:MAG: 3'(2'),5'-bisphosphate nucleotidase CysQ [Magnetococcales bacterium]|nr:3'(2'),5'-bisphosphate nucleotidase CysQ [Magnetococcales bacterium]NGZ26206.1 3'(2'),5'-bisphosphate nucleotidase CysQ [Magnetococcales bacterium]